MTKRIPHRASGTLGHLLALALAGWIAIVILPYVVAGLLACLAIWLLVRFHREIARILVLAGRLLGALFQCGASLLVALHARAACWRAARPMRNATPASPSVPAGQARNCSGWILKSGQGGGQP